MKSITSLFLCIFLFSLFLPFPDVTAEKELHNQFITNVFQTKKGIYFDTETTKKNVLVLNDSSDPGFLLSFHLEFVSKDKVWCVLSVSIGHEGPGRVMEFWELFYIPKRKVVLHTTLGSSPLIIESDENSEYIISMNDNRLYLNSLVKRKNEFQDIQVYVEDLKK